MFNKIRLSYLDDLENDPEIMEAIKDPIEEYLNDWIYVEDPADKSDWPAAAQKLSESEHGFSTPGYIGAWTSSEIGFFLTNMGSFEYDENDGASYFYHPESHVLAFFNPEVDLSLEDRKKIVILASLFFDGKLIDDSIMTKGHKYDIEHIRKAYDEVASGKNIQ